MTSNPEIPEEDLAEQETLADPAEDDTTIEGGPEDADEADWVDQRTEAPLDGPEEQ